MSDLRSATARLRTKLSIEMQSAAYLISAGLSQLFSAAGCLGLCHHSVFEDWLRPVASQRKAVSIVCAPTPSDMSLQFIGHRARHNH